MSGERAFSPLEGAGWTAFPCRGQSGEVADAANRLWRVEDLRETTVVILLFTMVFTSMLAGLRLAADVANR
jgi:hypothetical protein